MSIGVADLDTPYKRFAALPQAVNWRGTWDAQTEYFQNDIVLSPLDSAAYIQISASSTIQGGGDPSTNPDWFQFGSGAGGVQEIRSDPWISVSNTTNPTITNVGVRDFTLSPDLNNLGTATDPVLECTGVLQVVPGLGIDIQMSPLAIPQLFNTGVREVTGQNGIAIIDGLTPQDKKIYYTGLGTLTSPQPGLTVGPGATPLVTNTGLFSVATGVGIANSSTPQTPDLSNTGLLSVVGSGITVSPAGGAGAVTLSTVHPAVSQVGTIAAVMTPATLNTTNPTGRIAVTQTAGTDWATSISTGVPYATGTYVLDFILSLTLAGPTLDQGATRISLVDSVNNVVFQLGQLTWPNYNRSVITSPISSKIVGAKIDLTALRATGFKELTHIQFDPIFVGGDPATTVGFQATTGNLFGGYYAQSI